MTTDNPTPETPNAETVDTIETNSDIEIVDVRASSAGGSTSIDDDEVRKKFNELMEAIERRAKAEASSVGDWRVQAVEKAKETIEQTEQFARERQNEIEESVKSLQGEALGRWEALTQEAEDFTNRLQKAANEAWKIVMKEKEEEASNRAASDESAAAGDESAATDGSDDDSQAA